MQGVLHRRHRHCVAVPLVGILLLWSSAGAARGPRAEVMQGHAIASAADTQEPQVHRLPSGDAIAVFPGGSAVWGEGGDVTVLDGSAAAFGYGVMRMRAGSWQMTALAGAVYVSIQEDAVTVAALSAPVLVRRGHRTVFVPAGRQWVSPPIGHVVAGAAHAAVATEDRRTRPVPGHFLQRQADLLQRVEQAATVALPSAAPECPHPPQRLPLRVAGSRHRVWETYAVQCSGFLRSAAERADGAALREVLVSPTYADLRDTQAMGRMMGYLFRSGLLPRDLRMAALETLARREEDVLALAALHPLLSAEAWVHVSPQIPSDVFRALLLAFPFADNRTDSLPTFAYDRWRDALVSAAHRQEEAAFLHGLLQEVIPLVAQRDAAGYPERARRLRDALRAFSRDAYALPGDLRVALEELSAFDRVDAGTLLVEYASSSSSASEAFASHTPPFTADPAERRALAERLLLDGGALFLVSTSVSALPDGTVAVSDIAFEGPSGLRRFRFILDPAQGAVASIEENGVAFPYAMPLQDFAAWARAG